MEQWRLKVQLQRMVALDTSKRLADVMGDEEKIGKAVAFALGDPQVLEMLAQSQRPEAESAGGSVSGAGPEAAAGGAPAA